MHTGILKHIISAFLLFFIYSALFATNHFKTPAFPGAEGAGKYASGGRGGQVITVTNLNDSGEGSLRQAIEQKGPRIIVFNVSGTIELKKEITIHHGDVTIAGQSAPGDGICLKRYPLYIEADNVILRYIRIRLGDISGEALDAIHCKRSNNVIIDHCSFSWAVDECASFYDNQNFTLQWCIISESLNNSVHPKGKHGYGGIWGGMQASFHHNIIAHHTSRLPRFQGSRYHNQPEKEKTEFSNNLIYNWKHHCAYGGEQGNYNLINNVFIPGPATPEKEYFQILEPYEPYGNFYLENNKIILKKEKEKVWKDYNPKHHVPEEALINNPVKIISPVPVRTPEQAYEQILLYAGASKQRDAIDKRIVEEVKTITATFGRNGIIDTQQQVGEWPQLMQKAAPVDADSDGMPDNWEKEHNLNPKNSSDSALHKLSDIYTNIEVYLNELAINCTN